MARFVFRRLLISIPVVFAIIFLVFAVARILPGDPCLATLGERATPAQCQQFIQRYGLNKPIPEQFAIYLQDIAKGNLGTSIQTRQSVAEIIVSRLPTTVELSFLALTFAILIGIPLGIISAYRRNSAADVGSMVFANIGFSMPVFVLGYVLAFIFAVVLRGTPFALPPSGRLS